jgi:hypothetical protein
MISYDIICRLAAAGLKESIISAPSRPPEEALSDELEEAESVRR